MAMMESELSKPEYHADHERFKGVMCDTGANRSSTMSLTQCKAYCREHFSPGQLENAIIDERSKKKITGFWGTCSKLGQASIRIPIDGLSICPTFQFNTVSHNCPTIISLQDMKRMGVEILIQENCLILGKKKHKLILENDLLWLRWNSNDYILYTDDELRHPHRAFGHPSAKALENVLRRARQHKPDPRNILDDITKNCSSCAKSSKKPRIFKLTVGTEEYRFNHIVAMDIALCT